MFAIHFAAKLLRFCSDFARECFLLQILPWCSHLAIFFVVIFAAKLLRFCSKVAICERSFTVVSQYIYTVQCVIRINKYIKTEFMHAIVCRDVSVITIILNFVSIESKSNITSSILCIKLRAFICNIEKC